MSRPSFCRILLAVVLSLLLSTNNALSESVIAETSNVNPEASVSSAEIPSEAEISIEAASAEAISEDAASESSAPIISAPASAIAEAISEEFPSEEAVSISSASAEIMPEIPSETEEAEIPGEAAAPIAPAEAPDLETSDNEPTSAQSIVLDASQFTIGIGEQRAIHASLQPENSEDTLSYLSNDARIVTVSADGVITGKRAGDAQIIVSTENGIQAIAAVSVCKKPTSIKLDVKKLTLGVGQTHALSYSLGKGQAGSVSFSSSQTGVATVDGSGQIVATGVGTAKITAKTYNGKKATCTVTVKPAPDGVSLSHSSAVLGSGQTFDLSAQITKDSIGSVAFASDNPTVATVDNSGHVMAVSPGRAIITVQTYNGHTDNCTIEVNPAPTALSLSLPELKLGAGEKSAPLSVQLGDGSFTGGYAIQSSNAKIARIDGSGAVVAVRKGSATITVKSYNGLTAAIPVTVLTKPSRITLNPKTVTLSYGDRTTLTASYGKNQYGSYTFRSSDPSIVAVDDSGEVTGVGIGKATITVQSYNGKKASCTVLVKPEPNGVKISQSSAVLGVGQTLTLSGQTTNDSIGGFTFASSDPAIVNVDASGHVTATGCGTSSVTVQTYNGHTDSCSIEVRPAPTEIMVSQTRLTLGVGEKSAPLSIQLGDGSLIDGYTIQSSKEKVAKVNAGDVITGVKNGTAMITVKSYNGLTATIPVTVLMKPSRISLDSKTMALDAGETAALGVTFRPGQGGSCAFHSSDPTVATVDASGKITALTPGSATITAKTYNGKSASCTVRVLEPIADFGLKNAVTLGLNENIPLPIRATTAHGSPYQGDVRVSVSPSGIVQYANGRMLAKAIGTATMTVSAGQLTHTCTITVQSYRDVHPLSAVAHRGGGGNWPENTLEAFSNVASTGADVVELDVHTTADGVQVVFHDSVIADGDGKQHAITDCTIAELRKLKPDICTLDEALMVISNTNLTLMLEMKSSANGAACVDAIRRHHLDDRVMYISFYLDRLNDVRSTDQSADLGYIFSKVPKGVLQTASKFNLTALLPKGNILTQKLLTSYHAAGLKVGTWTINDAADILKFRNMDVDYITSDYPDRVASAR